jgi:methylphosphotriester-DNA--protein-cysteine methyltransferase
VYKHELLTSNELKSLIRSGKISLGGNRHLNIYGLLSCASGKRMKKENRIFFESKGEAIQKGYRPCGNCLRKDYLRWKKSNVG